jgi:hypothetical protein
VGPPPLPILLTGQGAESIFRGKFVAGLKHAFRLGRLALPGRLTRLADASVLRAFLRRLFRHDWVVYAKPPFGGPTHVLHYLARYTHRVAISNHRIINVADDQITFRWKDYAHGSHQRTMTVSPIEFLRRFALHVLPKGFVRIRFFGFLAHRRRAHDLSVCRRALETSPTLTPTVEPATPAASWPCPFCGGPMVVIERLTARQIRTSIFAVAVSFDSS